MSGEGCTVTVIRSPCSLASRRTDPGLLSGSVAFCAGCPCALSSGKLREMNTASAVNVTGERRAVRATCGNLEARFWQLSVRTNQFDETGLAVAAVAVASGASQNNWIIGIIECAHRSHVSCFNGHSGSAHHGSASVQRGTPTDMRQGERKKEALCPRDFNP